MPVTRFDQPSKILFVSTYPPVKCGIASFTQDLVNAIGDVTNENMLINVCALDNGDIGDEYELPVSMVMNGFRLSSCIDTAATINRDPAIKLVCIEHEFGLYGGQYGENLLTFLTSLLKPFVIRFHTVLPNPDPERLNIIKTIGSLASKMLVMTNHSARLLKEDYGQDATKIIIIPHGTHANSTVHVDKLKASYHLTNKLVLTTFGLLSPNKGIEKGIIAMKEISARYPDALYVVLGLTHPNLLKQEGEKYRTYLQQIIDENDLQKNIRLVNEYVPTEKLMEYLAMTDLYLFTSKDANQAVSGTFLYAMSAGCPIISNSFVLALEMLDDETGVIIHSDKELAEQAILLLQNEKRRKQMGHNAFLKMQETSWRKVAAQHASLFYKSLGKTAFTAKLPTVIG